MSESDSAHNRKHKFYIILRKTEGILFNELFYFKLSASKQPTVMALEIALQWYYHLVQYHPL